jgi:two-component system OmpR family sensor kinase
MRRVPLSLRLTVLFAGAMTVMLVALGALLYVRVGNALDEQIDDGLEQRAASIGSDRPAIALDDGFVAIVGTRLVLEDGEVPRAAVARARTTPTFVTVGDQRVLLTPARTGGVLAVGTSLDDRDEALANLSTELLLVGAIALGLAGVGGYVVARAATRPVLERLRRGLARERRFVADASHELRTPLTSLRAELDLALRRPRSSEELLAAVASAGEEVERLRRLADDLLVLARADEEGLELRRERLAARELLESVRRRFEASALGAGRELEVRAPELELVGDRLRLEQAVGNLVDNALRHGKGAVRLEAAAVDRIVRLAVCDEGAGIPQQHEPRAFERFTRADDARAGEGTGLGLAIVDAIARAHGGTVHATGAIVAIELPDQSSVK